MTWRIWRQVIPLLLLSGCSVAAQFGIPVVSPIHTISTRPPIGWTVYLEGEVGRLVPLVDQQAYQLRDRTGTIWVVTDRTAPPPGTQIKIRGKVRFEPIAMEEAQGEAYVEERDRSVLPP